MKVTVAICTWNRASLLDKTLERMKRLRIPDDISWELLIVNNNSTDNTDEVIAKHSNHLPIRRLLELKQGLSNARNCAIENTTAEWLVWTDDDVLVSPEWLSSFSETARRHPEAIAIGGPIDPWFPVKPSDELIEAFPVLRGGFIGIDYGNDERTLNEDEPIWGANMAFQLSKVKALRFDPELGRVKDSLVSGDDNDYLARAKATNSPVYYSPGMRLQHYVDPKRMTQEYLLDFYYNLGVTFSKMKMISGDRRIFGLPSWVYRKCLENAFASIINRVLGRRHNLLVNLREYNRCKGMITHNFSTLIKQKCV